MLDRDSTLEHRMRSRRTQIHRPAYQMEGYWMKDRYELALLHCDNKLLNAAQCHLITSIQ